MLIKLIELIQKKKQSACDALLFLVLSIGV